MQDAPSALLEEIEASRPATFDLESGYTPLTWHYIYTEQENDALYGKLVKHNGYPLPGSYAKRDDSIPLLVLRVNYADVQGCFSDAAWSDMIFNERTGLPAFYLENSNGKFSYRRAQESDGAINDGVVTAELPIVCPRYDGMTQYLKPGLFHGTDGRDYAIYDVPMLFAYAVAAVEDKLDFAAYDTHGDGRIDAYGKLYLDFYDATELKEDGRYPLAPASDSANYGILRIPTEDPMVYYLVENRQLSGFDEGLYYKMRYYLFYPGHMEGGLVVWRIDEHVLETMWDENTPNNTEGRYGVMPLFFADDPDGDPTLSVKERYPFLKDGMAPAVLTDSSEATTLRAIGPESDWTIIGDGVLAADLSGLPDFPEPPDTGDSAHPLLWLALCLFSGLGLLLLRRRARRC